MRSLACIFMLLVLPGIAAAERPRLVTIDDPLQPHITEAAAPYNTIFLNRCASGCAVKPGNTDSRVDTSGIVQSSHVLGQFPFGDDTWNKVKACVRDTFAPFNVVITDTDPGSASHFEIMVGGKPQDLGFDPNFGGVSPNGCGSTYIPNALVFDFASVWSNGASTCGATCVEDICSTAAQEIAHSLGMDHSHNKLDPMTYFPYTGRKYFQTTADQCGSDCNGGTGPAGQTCTGTDKQVHSCCQATATQNSAAILTSLFGAGTLALPTVQITKPQQGASVQAGFAVNTTITADAAITKAELRVDGMLVDPVVMSAPYAFNAPATLQPGSHTVEVTGYDAHGTPGKTSITVTIGPPCTDDSTCATAEVCIAGRCVPGPNVTGGLGTTCTGNEMCGDANCASDGTNMYCTSACHAGQCPSGFGCLPLADGSDAGYCWPGYSDNGGGGCSTSGAAGGSIASGLVFAALLFTRRRKR
ncbi:hypothetical protein BH11MYX1_BH11MYX1_56410 [soil metagenome]